MKEYQNPHALVTTEWLYKNLTKPDVVVLDATWHLPPLRKDAKADFFQAHIPGARYFDIDAVSDSGTTLPHMLPDASEFETKIGELGISNHSHIVVYDAYGLFSAARVWWMFRIFGHDNISILNGGSLKWAAEGKSLTNELVPYQSTEFHATFHPELVCQLDDVLTNINSQKAQVLDARSRDRFFAKAPEPRPGLRSGHIPNSNSLPFNMLLDENTKEILPADSLTKIFQTEKIDLNKPVICSCGTGVTACALAFGLFLLGKDDAIIYDGSWTEWGSSSTTPVDV